jgi:hypothetical protein
MPSQLRPSFPAIGKNTTAEAQTSEVSAALASLSIGLEMSHDKRS